MDTYATLIDEQYKVIDEQAKIIWDSKHTTEALKKQMESLNETLAELNRTNQEQKAQVSEFWAEFQNLNKKGESGSLSGMEHLLFDQKTNDFPLYSVLYMCMIMIMLSSC